MPGNTPPLGQPAYGAMFPLGRPGELLSDPSLRPGNIRDFPPRHGWAPGAKLDPLSQARSVAGATLSESYVLRTLGPNHQMKRPLVGMSVQIWTLQGIRAQVPDQRD